MYKLIYGDVIDIFCFASTHNFIKLMILEHNDKPLYVPKDTLNLNKSVELASASKINLNISNFNIRCLFALITNLLFKAFKHE